MRDLQWCVDSQSAEVGCHCRTNQIVDKNQGCCWTSRESYLLRLYFCVFQHSVVSLTHSLSHSPTHHHNRVCLAPQEGESPSLPKEGEQPEGGN